MLVVGDGPLREELEQYAEESGIAQKVIFLGERYDVPEILKVSDCFVLCSDYESFGLVILEAMMCGVPVIATRVGGIGEIIEDAVVGTLILKNDTKALADAVIKIRNNPQYFQEIAARAKDHVINHYGIDRTIRAYERIYKDVTLQ